MAWSGEKKHITVHQIMEACPTFGIPHFQRGLVWGNDSVSALLESLFLETPCGSFVFWRSGDNTRNGIPLLPGSGRPIEYLIVDGQQRIRSLYEVFNHVDANHLDNGASESVQNEADTAPRIWCLNLTRATDVGHLFRPHGKDYSLFVLTADPRKADSRSPLRYNVLPLVSLLADPPVSLSPFQACLRFNDADAQERFQSRFPALLKRVRAIRSREFFVTVKDTENQSEIVGLYNRINTGGKRVEAEERAFSRLAAMDLDVWDQITRIFELIHPPERPDGDPTTQTALRDQVLKRQKENLFGFKLFIRTFLQVCNYHFNQPIGTSGLSFALVDRKSFSDRLRGAGPEGAERLWAITREVITHVHDVLKHDLCCDELALLPETQSLIPVFQVLIQYPQLRTEQKYRSLLAWVTILLLLAEPNTRDVLHWSSRIQQESGAAFHQFPLLLRELAGRVKTRLHKDNVLAEASSIQNRYVLLLYWLLRRDGARDFSYRNVTSGKLLDRIGHERLLEKAARPEKQHIIPFSRLMRKLGDPDARRGSSHRFNNIGNLTYISHELNHYEAGLGDRFIDLEHDSREPAALRAHHLWDTNPAGTVQDLYLRARRLFGEEDPASREQAEKLYEEFCRRRRSLIRDALSRWLEELEAETFGALRVKDLGELEALGRGDARLESATPMFVPTRELRPDQRVRLFDYENPVEDELVAFLRSLPRRSIVPMDQALEVKLTDKKHVWLRLDRDRVSIFFHNRIDKRLQGEILAVLGMEDGENLLYQRGSERTDTLEKLGAARDRAQALKEKIEQSILDHEPLPAPKMLNFLEKWENHIGTSAVDDLHRFRERFESLQDLQPKVLTDYKQKPLFALQLGQHPFHVFMPRNCKPSLRENFRHPSFKQAGALDAVRLFKQRLLDVELADEYGKCSTIEIPITRALARFEELSGYLKDLASGLPSPSDAGGKSKNTGGKWNEETFFASARQHLKDPAVFERTRKLYEFMLDHGRVDFGTGREYPSLTYKVGTSLAKSGCVSVLTVWAHGSMTFRTGNIRRNLGKPLAEYFCDQLTDLQVTEGWDKKKTLEGYGPTAPLQEVFRDDESLAILKEAILHFLGEAEKMLQRNA